MSHKTHGGRVTAVWRFIRLGRPQFLLGGFATYGLGAAIAHGGGRQLDWKQYMAGQVVVTCFQLMTHYANDYFDFDADCANHTSTRWSGGSRILPSHLSMRPAALAAALGFFGLGVAASVWVLSESTGPLVPMLLVAIPTLAWVYSAPPVRLHSRGLGELAAAVVVATLVPWLACAIQAARPSALELAAVFPLVPMHAAMLMVIGVPDQHADASVGKRTLVVRLGARASAALHNTLLFLAYLSFVALMVCGIAPPPSTVIVMTGPLACMQAVRIARGQFRDPRHWESLAFCAVALVLLSALAELVGFLNVGAAKNHQPS